MLIVRNTAPKNKPQGKLGFGKYFTDHMFIMEYSQEEGWHDSKVVPYGPFQLPPSASVYHYGQAIFEGMKCYYGADGSVRLFRPFDNFNRLNCSADRIVIPRIDVNVAMEGLRALVEVDKDWIPSEPETALYIRPTIISTEPFLGVHASVSYIFFIILSPVGSYYEKGMNPINIYVEDVYSRSAATGGTGAAKFAGNYAASMIAGTKAKKEGFDQVLWLDSNSRKNIEEVGAMNICFLLGDTLVTPSLSGTILSGITRDSILILAKDMGYKCVERTITIEELIAAQESGLLKEMFGTGTAAVVSPVGMFRYKDKDYMVSDGKIGDATLKFYNRLCAIQRGTEPDKFGWIVNL